MADAALVFLAAAAVSLLSGRYAIRFLSNAQCFQPVRYEDCPALASYDDAKRNTPTMGGLVVIAGGIFVALIAGGLQQPEGWWILCALVGMGAVGFVDDIAKCRGRKGVGLRGLPKLFIALLIGLCIALGIDALGNQYRIVALPWLHQGIDFGWAWIPFAILVIAGSAHAVNLTDGMDGLSAGCVAIALPVFSVWAVEQGSVDTVVVTWIFALSGACVGFLWFNGFPASVFLGDVGALGLGAALAVISLLTHASLALLIVGGVFVIETLSVVGQVASYKWRNKRRLFRVAPMHHHFQLGGLSEPKLIIRFWIVGVLLAMAALTMKLTS